MSDLDFTLNAEVRDVQGKGASRRLRREADKVPAIVYGGKKKPENIQIAANEFRKALENEAFYAHVITLNIGDKSEQVILQDLQRHPAKGHAMHADFARVSKTKKIHKKIPLHFINEESCVGVKTGGGIISHLLTELDVTCLAADLPEFIEVDVAALEVGDSLHISDLKLPKGVTSVDLSHGEDHDLPVASVIKPRGMAEATEAEGEAEGEEASE